MARREAHKRMTAEEQARYSASSDHRTYASREGIRSATHERTSSNRAARHAGTPQHAASRADGAASQYARQRTVTKRSGIGKKVLIALLVLLAIGGGAAGWFLFNVNSRLSSGIDPRMQQVLSDSSMNEPFYMLLLGVDKDNDRSEEWGSYEGNFRADSIILARIDTKGRKVTLVSIPRDTEVDYGDGTKGKINSVYSDGGAAHMVEVVSNLAGVPISHYAEIDFEQFVDIVDLIGGIEVTLPVPVSDWENAGIDLPAGTQTLCGGDALGLVRSRHAYDEYGGGDFYRSANQRMVIAAIIKKVLAQPASSLPGIVTAMADSVVTDLSVDQIVGLALAMKDLNTDNDIYAGQLPTVSEYIDDVWYEEIDNVSWAKMMSRVKAGKPPYENDDEDFTAGVAGSVGVDGNSGLIDYGSLEPQYDGYVLVLNGTGIAGVAFEKSEILEDAGFDPTADNADDFEHQTTHVYFTGSSTGASRALGVIEALGLNATPEKNNGRYSEDYDVIVVIGLDAVSSEQESTSGE